MSEYSGQRIQVGMSLASWSSGPVLQSALGSLAAMASVMKRRQHSSGVAGGSTTSLCFSCASREIARVTDRPIPMVLIAIDSLSRLASCSRSIGLSAGFPPALCLKVSAKTRT